MLLNEKRGDGLLRFSSQPANGAGSLPHFNVVTVDQLFGVFDRCFIRREIDHLKRGSEGPVLEKVDTIVRHSFDDAIHMPSMDDSGRVP